MTDDEMHDADYGHAIAMHDLAMSAIEYLNDHRDEMERDAERGCETAQGFLAAARQWYEAFTKAQEHSRGE